MEQTVHGGDLLTWRQRYPGREWVDFSINCNPFGMPDRVGRAYREALERCTAYPDPLCRDLKKALGEWEEVDPEWIVCGNGACDIIYRIAYALRPTRALLPAPTFSEYEAALEQVGCEVEHYPLREEGGFAPDEGLLRRLPGKDILFLCNPNNPTGTAIQPELLERIALTCARQETILVVDECFQDFFPDRERYTAKGLLKLHDQLIIINAFTKTFAIPGIRLGHGIAADPVIRRRLERAGAAWSVSAPAQQCGIAASQEREWLQDTRRWIEQQRQSMTEALRSFGFRVFPSKANYLLVKTGTPDLQLQLAERGILVRSCRNFQGLGDGDYRFAVRRPEENNMLLGTLAELCRTADVL